MRRVRDDGTPAVGFARSRTAGPMIGWRPAIVINYQIPPNCSTRVPCPVGPRGGRDPLEIASKSVSGPELREPMDFTTRCSGSPEGTTGNLAAASMRPLRGWCRQGGPATTCSRLLASVATPRRRHGAPCAQGPRARRLRGDAAQQPRPVPHNRTIRKTFRKSFNRLRPDNRHNRVSTCGLAPRVENWRPCAATDD